MEGLGAQLHLLVNHLPVIVPAIGALIVVFGLIRKSPQVRDVGAIVIVLAALSAIPAYLTGEPAEKVLKNYPEFPRQLVHDHERAAFWALTWAEVSGAISLALLVAVYLKKPLARRAWPWVVALVFTAFSLAVTARTAHLGGLIRHEEIRTSDRF